MGTKRCMIPDRKGDRYREELQIWHYETADLQKLCKRIDPRFRSIYGVVGNTTRNAKHVTCEKCLAILAGQK